MVDTEHACSGISWRRLATALPERHVLLLFLLLSGLLNLQFGRQSDSAPAYIACRLLASGQAGHLYDHDAGKFERVNSAVWTQAAEDIGHPVRRNHPYIQLPLYADALRPLCTTLPLKAFDALLSLINAFCLFLGLRLIARNSLPAADRLAGLAAMTVLSLTTMPWLYHLQLGQNHALILWLCLYGLHQADCRKPVRAGLCIGVASAIKLSPLMLLAYLMARRHWQASLFTLLTTAGLYLLSDWVEGPQVFMTYLDNLQRISSTLIVAFNNDSLVTWLPQAQALSAQDLSFTSYPMPPHYSLLLYTLGGTLMLLAGWLDQRATTTEKYGAQIALLAMTVCAPLSWIHYFLLLPAALTVLAWQPGPVRWLAGLAWPLLLLSPGFAPLHGLSSPLLIRPELTASLLTMAGLILLARHAAGARHA